MYVTTVKGGETMKKLMTLLMVAVLALSLSACAGMKKEEKARVKCPACGYEFEQPMPGGG
jgi:uncharacterized lipoprotein YehR (DUF1307 family)